MPDAKSKIEKGNLVIKKSLILSDNLFPVVGIGASAGGLDAFKKLLQAIPENSGMAYVLVQHLDPNHESLLVELLQKVTSIPVIEITDEIKVQPNHIYIIPSNKVIIANDGVLELTPRPSKKTKDQPGHNIERNLPIDLFFASLAEVHQNHAIGVILSGTASDGTLGLKAIKDHGGLTFAQEVSSAAYEGMPHSAIQSGVVDFILPPEQIPQKLLEVMLIINGGSEGAIPPGDEDLYKQILALLRIRKKTDFTHYKPTTIRRRILRRMTLHNYTGLFEYLKLLQESTAEQDLLYHDLLILVTSFFRDPQVFDKLCSSVFSPILRNKANHLPIRIWVAGCSTGEEVYSIAICIIEYLGDSAEKVQIFATDISEPAIARARGGMYKKVDTVGLSEQRLAEFFTKTSTGYQVNKQVRDMCVFAVHNFLKDPPFGKIDFISCRNVLIYMEPYLQKIALSTFHYALNPNGFLLLGKSETTSGVPDLFTSEKSKEGKKGKLFIRKDVPGKFMRITSRQREQNFTKEDTHLPTQKISTDFQKTADEILLSRFTPAGVVINEAMDILHFRGSTGHFLEAAPGKASLNLMKMAKPGLAFEIRSVLNKAKKENRIFIKNNISLLINDAQQLISVEIIPLQNIVEPHYLILFHLTGESQTLNSVKKSRKKINLVTESDGADMRVQQLEKELAQVREDMRSITQEQETANEELQEANEELISGSEELQSLNEEMETSKEELQSSNEELMVVNQEMITLNEQLTVAKNYAEAILITIREPLLVLDKNLRVKSANNSFYKTFQSIEREIEGRLIYEIGNRLWDIPELRILLEELLPQKSKFIDFEVAINIPNAGRRIMLLNAREIVTDTTSEKLILLAIEDITDRKEAQRKMEESEERFRLLADNAPMWVWISDTKINVLYANLEVLNYIGISNHSQFTALTWQKSIHPDDIEMVLENFERALTEKNNFEFEARAQKLGSGIYEWFYFKGIPRIEASSFNGFIGNAININERKIQLQLIKRSEETFRQLAELMPDKVTTTDIAGQATYFNKHWTVYTGLKQDELLGRGWEKIMHPDEMETIKEQWKNSLTTGADFEMELRCRDKNGEYKWHLSRAIAILDEVGKIKTWISTTTDIQSIKEEEQRKGDFLKMVSHELKTPVTSIKGYVQLLLSIIEEETMHSSVLPFKSSLVRIDSQVKRLTRLITEILDLTRIEAGKLELQQEVFQLDQLLEETLLDIRFTNTKHLIKVEKEITAKVYADKDRIGQVIINIVNNSIKYSPESKDVKVRLFAAANNMVAVSVQDFGIGIDIADQEKIFERFYRAGGASEKNIAGFGIGLFITKEIINRHNGSITIESKKGEGSIFTFFLPVRC